MSPSCLDFVLQLLGVIRLLTETFMGQYTASQGQQFVPGSYPNLKDNILQTAVDPERAEDCTPITVSWSDFSSLTYSYCILWKYCFYLLSDIYRKRRISTDL